MSSQSTEVNSSPNLKLSFAQRCFVHAVCEVIENAGRRAYTQSAYKDANGKWWCDATHPGYAMFLCAEAVEWDFRDSYEKLWTWTCKNPAKSWSEKAWDVYYVWRAIRKYLKRSTADKIFWREVRGEWLQEMRMWLLMPDFYFVDGEDPTGGDPCLALDYNWFTLSPKDEERLKRHRRYIRDRYIKGGKE